MYYRPLCFFVENNWRCHEKDTGKSLKGTQIIAMRGAVGVSLCQSMTVLHHNLEAVRQEKRMQLGLLRCIQRRVQT